LKRTILVFKILVFSFVLFFPAVVKAQAPTRSILYLKNGSVIKCDLISVNADSVLIIKTSDDNQMTYRCDQVDSLINLAGDLSSIPVQPTEKKQKRNRLSGIYLGGCMPLGENSSRVEGGMFAGAQLGIGLNPGFLVQFGCGSFTTSGSLSGNSLFFSLALGMRFGLNDSSSTTNLYISPLIGLITGDKLQVAIGVSVDWHIASKIFVGTRLMAAAASLDPAPYSSNQLKSYIAFVVGYGSR
jgi:hypothetical protein